MMKLKFYISIIIILITTSVFAQEATLTTKVSKNKLGVNQRLRVEFSIDKQGGENFTPPKFTNFKVVGGPSQSVSQSWINGKVSFNQSYTYIVQPKRKGELSIGAASVVIGGKTILSKPKKIIVLDAVEIPKNPNDPNYIAQQNVHLVAEVSKTRPYVGEGIYVEYRLYVSDNIIIYDSRIPEPPQYIGFWNQEIKINGYREKRGKYNGEDYKYFTLGKALLIPTKSGKLEIEPIDMEIRIGVPTGRADFFGNVITRNIVKEFSSAKKIIRSKSLPLEGKPENFTGAVGDFNFAVTLSKDILKSNESSQIKLGVTGKGNLKLFELPEVTTPVELEKYQPERKEKVRVSANGISGSVSDLYTIVPQYKGKYKIPSTNFSYFNPKEEKYYTLSSEDLFVDVIEGKELVTNTVKEDSLVQKQDVKITGKNFRYIQTKSSFESIFQKDFFKSNWFYFLLLFPLLLIPLGIFISKRNEERSNDIVGNKLRKANKLAKKYLSEAKKQLGNKEAFYEALERALHNYLKAKLGIETADISKEKITQILEDKKVDNTTIQQFIEVLKSSDFARYTPFTATQMEQEFERAKQVIVALDKQL
ncbi:MAG: BatD family protein [Polaribacter sp.]